MVGYYNRGLTMLEDREAALPGVTFRVECGALEHPHPGQRPTR